MHTCTHKYILSHTHTHTHVSSSKNMRAYTHTYMYTYIHTHIHEYIYTCIRTSTHTHVSLQQQQHARIHAYLHTSHVYMHTHVHTCIHTRLEHSHKSALWRGTISRAHGLEHRVDIPNPSRKHTLSAPVLTLRNAYPILSPAAARMEHHVVYIPRRCLNGRLLRVPQALLHVSGGRYQR